MKKFRHKTREMLAPRTTKESMSSKIIALNQFIRGWCNYSRGTSVPSKPFKKLTNEIFWNMAHWLGRKYKISMPEVMQRYVEGSTFKTKSTTLIMPSEYKAKKLMAKTWHNPYTAKEEIEREKFLSYENLWNGKEGDRLGWHDLREEVILTKGTTCYLVGTKFTRPSVERLSRTASRRILGSLPFPAARRRIAHGYRTLPPTLAWRTRSSPPARRVRSGNPSHPPVGGYVPVGRHGASGGAEFCPAFSQKAPHWGATVGLTPGVAGLGTPQPRAERIR